MNNNNNIIKRIDINNSFFVENNIKWTTQNKVVKVNNLYIKLFGKNENMSYLTNILLNEKFFVLFPALNKIIYDKEKIIGYITYKGESCSKNDLTYFMKSNEKVLNIMIYEYKYWYYDFKPENLVRFNNKLSLIDLDSFVSLKNELFDFKQKYPINSHSSYIFNLIKLFNTKSYYENVNKANLLYFPKENIRIYGDPNTKFYTN